MAHHSAGGPSLRDGLSNDAEWTAMREKATMNTTSTPWKFCPQCGHELQATWKYCPECGMSIGAIAVIYVPINLPVNVPVLSPPYAPPFQPSTGPYWPQNIWQTGVQIASSSYVADPNMQTSFTNGTATPMIQ
jgi:hypothetical protein